MNYRETINEWLTSTALTETEKEQVKAIEKDDEKAQLYFSATMSFGTAGLRSVMDMGPGCMNRFTVAHITQAIASLVLLEDGAKQGVAIAYDSRHNSREFAMTAASVLAANGICVYLFDDLRPTPELSFAIRNLGCKAGINITASHNPKEYNGYKAYWEDGAQISPAQADIVCAKAAEIDRLTGAKLCDLETAISEGTVKMLGRELDDAYLDAVMQTAIAPEVVQKAADSLKIVYTPLHGAGCRLVPKILSKMGLKHLFTVGAQMTPDGAFPTVKKPNPEYADVFEPGVKIAHVVGSDLVVATDPDADRIGVMCRGKNGKFFTVTGNQMGALLLDYVIRSRKEAGTLGEDDYAVKSFVSTDLANRICEVQGVKLYEVPTGFKFIGEVIKGYEEGQKAGNFLEGFEESYGYLFGSYARDKDAVGAAMMIVEMTAWYALQGKNLGDALLELYETYGYYGEGMIDIYMEGLDGIARRRTVMENLRQNTPAFIGEVKVVAASDYQCGKETNLESGEETETSLKDIDVLAYKLESGDKIIIRPSGTEPKIKIYMLCNAQTKEALNQKLALYNQTAGKLCEIE
ncbi:MAG: phospho-sugar mutase [Clostridia bacterium]|nr:phospho-sugar mutase [Clostridia bacterium]